ncbi:MAG: MFS transporter [Christensenellales bacterium]
MKNDNQSRTVYIKSKGFLSVKRQNLFRSFASDRDFNLLLAAGFITGIAGGIHVAIFNNFLNDVYHLSETARGFVEIPRELPGVLMIAIFAGLSFLGSTRLASLSMILSAIGMLGLGVFSPDFSMMIVWMVVLNLGIHIFMPLVPGMGMHLSDQQNYGIRLARYNAYNLAATIVGYLIVWLGFEYLGILYAEAFTIAAVCFFIGGILLMYMKPQQTDAKLRRFVFKKKFMLFYLLSMANGARKQIFLTFAPWVLIRIYGIDTPTFAIYGFIVAALSIGTRTIVGKAIDRLGERIVLTAEAILLIVLCIGYAFSGDIFPATVALVITAGCYIVDNSLSAVEMARSTYVKKISDDPSEVIPTLSTGVSLDHVVSMFIPVCGGLLWAAIGYQVVFICASLIAVFNLILSLLIRTKE